MIWALAIIFALVWVIGLITSYTLGGAIHALLAVAVVLLLIATFKAGMRFRRRNAPPLTSTTKHGATAAGGTAVTAKTPIKGAMARTKGGTT